MESKEGNKREEQKEKGKEKTRIKGGDDQKGKRNNKEALHTQTVGNRGGPLGKEVKGKEKDGDKDNKWDTRDKKQPRERKGEVKKGIG